MALTLTENRIRTETETVKRTLKAPKNFGMFSSAGNQRLKGYTNTLLRQVEKGKNVRSAVLDYLKKYHRLSDDDRFTEASDTMVREIVRGFAEDVLKAKGYNPGEAYEVECELNRQAQDAIR